MDTTTSDAAAEPADRSRERELSPAAAARVIADPAAAPRAKLYACKALVERGFFPRALPVLAELEKRPELAFDVRRVMALARFAAKTLALLDFEGKRPAQGRWATLDGRAPGSAREPTGALLWLRPGSKKVVFVFSNVHGGNGPLRGWMSFALVHRVLAPLPVNIVYIKDETGCLHFAGIRGLGKDYAACLAGLRALCERGGWAELYGFGNSSGGYSALRFGLDLRARGVISLSGASTMAPPDDPGERDPRLELFHRKVPELAVDLLPLFRRSAVRPRLYLCFGEHNAHDAEMARRMAEFPEAELVPFLGFDGHGTLLEGLHSGKLEQLAARMVA